MSVLRLSLLAVCFFAASHLPLFAQVEVGLELNYKKYLLFEPVAAKITVKNISGRQIVLNENGSEGAVLSVDIRNGKGYPAERRNAAMLEKPIVLESQQKTELLVYLNSAYTINKIDAYTAKAAVRLGDYAYTSEKRFFDTYEGSIESKMVTLEPPRVYTLRKISRAQKGIFLYARIDESDGTMNYGVQILDTLVPVFNPRMALDGKGNLHTLHRKSPQQYVEVVLSPDARELERTYYRGGFGKINFMQDEAGQIRVAGLVKIEP